MLRGVVALHLALLFLGSLPPHAESAEEEFRSIHHAPSPSPMFAPFPPSTSIHLAPSAPPLFAPFPPPPSRRTKTQNIVVEGVIYCKACKLPGYDRNLNASPLSDVPVKVQCSTGKNKTLKTGRTNGRGYFFIKLPKVPIALIAKCRVFVVSLPPICNRSVYPKDIKTIGAPLMFERFEKEGSTVWSLYTAGFFLFGPTHLRMCPHSLEG